MNNFSNELVSVVVTTCGAGEYLLHCLRSLKAQIFRNLEVILIDNSQDKVLSAMAACEYPGIRIYFPGERLSFCESLNLGIRESRGAFILCSNDDAVLDPRYITEAVKGFSRSEKIGMVSGKILRPGAGIIDSTGLFLSFFRTAKERGYGSRDIGRFDSEEYIFGVNGAVAFYRRSMLEAVKIYGWYFDPAFGFFYEDLDISWRAQRMGWKAYYLPQAVAYHARGGSLRLESGAGKPYARKYLNDELYCDLVKNRYLAIIRNESLLGLLLHFPGILIYDLFAWGHLLIFRPKALKKILLKRQCLFAALKVRISG